MTLVQVLSLIPTVLALGLLLIFGRAPERIAAAAFIAIVFGSPAVQHLEFHNVRWAVAALSLGLLAVLTWLALTADRWWLLAAAGFQLVGFGTYVVALFQPEVLIWSGIALRRIIWLQLMLACAFGAWEGRKAQPSGWRSGSDGSIPR